MREYVWLECTDCGQRNYRVIKETRGTDRLELKKYCPKTLHCARHTNATLMFQASNSNLRMVQKQLGHSRITTTQIYADVMPQVMQLRRLMKSMVMCGSILRNRWQFTGNGLP